jgi:N-acetylglucosaminyl-diphospho-decaprenol L-rhamnosyltransferase
MSLSILIVNWNSRDYLRKCLHTVRFTCQELSPQVIVVDAGSFDGCRLMLATEFPEVEFMQSRENLGFARSNNLGFQHAKGEFVLLLNPDTELQQGAVATLLSVLQSRSDCGIAAPRLLNTDGSLQTSCVSALPTPWNAFLDSEALRNLFPRWRIWGTWEAFSASEPVGVEAVSGACMLMRSETFRKAGGFNPYFFMYAEDRDLCAKVRRLGFKVCHVPAAKVVHHGGGSSQVQTSDFSILMKRIANKTYMKLNHGYGSALLYRFLQGFSAAVRLCLLAPGICFLRGRRRTSALSALRKWWVVLRWALGLPTMRLPTPGVFPGAEHPQLSTLEKSQQRHLSRSQR